jgi:hypothetical protein
MFKIFKILEALQILRKCLIFLKSIIDENTYSNFAPVSTGGCDVQYMEPGFSLAFLAHFEARTSEGHENANTIAHLKNIEM